MYQDMRPIERVEGCSPDAIPEYVLTSTKPLVLKGLVKQWPVVAEAQKSSEAAYDYICKFYNGELVNTAIGDVNNEGSVFYNNDLSGFNYQRKKTRLDSVLSEVRANEERDPAPVYYVDSCPVDSCLPDFRRENDLKIANYSPRVSLWLGNKTVVSAHFDVPANIACVIMGRRRFTLFPPEQLTNLYVGPLDFNPAGQAISMANLKQPDFEKFPKLREAFQAAFVAELELGDALYIPSMWWHHVEGLDNFNAMINYWWTTVPDYIGGPSDAFNHALMSIKALPESERKSWKNMFDYYIFESKPENFLHIPVERLGVLGDVDEATIRRMRASLLNRLNR
jgi:hypothetical protein